MTTDDEILQRAPKGWKKRRGAEYTWMPSKASEFGEDKGDFFAPKISIGDPTYSIEDEFEEKEKKFSEGAYLTLSVDNVYFVENEESEQELDFEKNTVEFLDLEEDYEFVVQIRNLTLEEAKRKAKQWMQEIQSEEELGNFIQEKEKVLYGIDTFDIRNLSVSTFDFDVDEENIRDIGRTNNVLFLSNDKEAVKEYLVDDKITQLEEEAKRKKELIEKNLADRVDFVKSLDQNLINMD